MLKQELGSELRKLRGLNGMTQRELAEVLYTTDKSVSRWENGDSMVSLEMLSEILYKLGNTPFSIRDQQIKLGDEIMSKMEVFSQTFRDFKVAEATESLLNQRKAVLYERRERMENVFSDLKTEGFTITTEYFPERLEYCDANHCDQKI